MRVFSGVAFAACLLVLGTSASAADESKPVKSKLSDQSSAGCYHAKQVNFRKELGVHFEYLESLGERIHKARKSPDPVDLALAAESLSVAEKVAGKKASLTAEDVLKEAVELAKLRRISSELSAVSLVVTSSDDKKELTELAATAKKAEAEAKKALEAGEKSREIHGTLRVENRTPYPMNIYLNGWYGGVVFPFSTFDFSVNTNTPVDIYEAFSPDGFVRRRRQEFGATTFYFWQIFP